MGPELDLPSLGQPSSLAGFCLLYRSLSTLFQHHMRPDASVGWQDQWIARAWAHIQIQLLLKVLLDKSNVRKIVHESKNYGSHRMTKNEEGKSKS